MIRFPVGRPPKAACRRARALRPSAQELESRHLLYSVALGGGLPVHEDFTQFGYALFTKQFGTSDLDAIPSVIDELRTGAREEDDNLMPREPFFESSPSGNHFWGHDVSYNRTLGFPLVPVVTESAPARALRILAEEGGIANLFKADPAKAARYLGHVAHLLQDMTVPSHAHADPHYDGSLGVVPGGLITVTDFDPYHDYVDGIEFSTAGVFRVDDTYVASFNDGPRTRHIGFAVPALTGEGDDLRRPSDVPAFAGDRMAGLFFENATAAAAYDTKDYVGSRTGGLFGRGRPIVVDTPTALGIRQFFPAASYGSFSQGELIAQANDLVPRAVRSTAELFRYFYSLTDTDDPVVDLPKLRSKDPSVPQAIPSARIELIAAASDQDDPMAEPGSDSGVGKDLFRFEFAEVNPDGSRGEWQQLAPDGPGAHFRDGGGQFGPDFAGKHGATARAGLPADPTKVYAVRASAEDGSGRRGTSEVYYVRYGEPAVTEVTVIDQSGSMSGAPLASAIASASAALGTRSDFDRIGVVSFSSSASVIYPLTTIAPGSMAREQAQAAIESLTAGGSTSIGAGLLAAVGMLDPEDPDDGRGQTSIVVLTDGEENTSPFIADVAGRIPGYVSVHGIALGGGADPEAVQRLARSRGGQFFAAEDAGDLPAVYARVSGAVTGEQDVARMTGTIAPGGRRTMTFQVDASAGGLTVGVTWPGSDLDLILVGPDGRLYHRSDPGGGRFTIGTTAEFFRLPSATPGTWTAVVDAIEVPEQGEPFELFARVASPIAAELLTPTQTLARGEHLPIRLRLTGGPPILGAGVVASLMPTVPGAAPIQTVQLFDDGSHGDEVAGDGIYSNSTLIGAIGDGVYTLQVEAAGQGFVRAPSQLLLISGEAPENTAPTISEVDDQVLVLGASTGMAGVVVGDAESSADELRVTVTSSNPQLLPDSGILIAGAGTDRQLTFAPEPGRAGTSTVTLTVTDPGGRTASTQFRVTVNAPTRVEGLRRFGAHAWPTRLIVGLSGGLDAARAVDPTNYRLLAPGRDGRFGTRDDLPIGLRSVDYDEGSQTVSIVPARRLSLRGPYQLTMVGSGPGGLADRFGNLLDGDGDGQPGGDFVARVDRSTFVGIAAELRARRAVARPFPAGPRLSAPRASRG